MQDDCTAGSARTTRSAGSGLVWSAQCELVSAGTVLACRDEREGRMRGDRKGRGKREIQRQREKKRETETRREGKKMGETWQKPRHGEKERERKRDRG